MSVTREQMIDASVRQAARWIVSWQPAQRDLLGRIAKCEAADLARTWQPFVAFVQLNYRDLARLREVQVMGT